MPSNTEAAPDRPIQRPEAALEGAIAAIADAASRSFDPADSTAEPAIGQGGVSHWRCLTELLVGHAWARLAAGIAGAAPWPAGRGEGAGPTAGRELSPAAPARLDEAIRLALSAGVRHADVLCQVYETAVALEAGASGTRARHARKRAGAYFTPVPLVDQLIQRVLPDGPDRLLDHTNGRPPGARCGPTAAIGDGIGQPVEADVPRARHGRLPRQRLAMTVRADCLPDIAAERWRALDPACGSGRLLLATARRLAGSPGASPRDGGAEALASVIGEGIYGVDADPLAVEVCRHALWLEAGGRVPLTRLAARIQWGDSLTGPVRGEPPALLTPRPDKPATPPPIAWASAFPEVAAAGGFDIVLANPPFGNAIEAATRRTPDQRQALQRRYPLVARGAYDLSSLFAARAVELLAAGGRYGLICPRSLLSAEGSRPLRAWLDQVAPPASIWCPNEPAWFAGATVYVCVVAGRKAANPIAGLPAGDAPPSRPTSLAGATWWTQVAADPAIGTLAPGGCVGLAEIAEISAGCATSIAYELGPRVKDQPRGAGSRLVTTGVIDRFGCRWGVSHQRFLGRDFRHPRWPPGATPAADRARLRQSRPKLLVAGLSRVVEAFADEGEHAGVVSTLVVAPRDATQRTLLRLAALLNAPVFSYLYLTRFGARELAGGNCPIGKRELSRIEVPADTPVDATEPGPPVPAAWSVLLGPGGLTRQALWREIEAAALALTATPPTSPGDPVDRRLRALIAAAYGLTPDQHAPIDAWWVARAGAAFRHESRRRAQRPGPGPGR